MTRQTIQSPDPPPPSARTRRRFASATLSICPADRSRPADRTTRRGLESASASGVKNLRAVAAAAGGALDDIVKVSVLIMDLGEFAKVNEIMRRTSRRRIGRATIKSPPPRGALVEVEGTLVLPRGLRRMRKRDGAKRSTDQGA